MLAVKETLSLCGLTGFSCEYATVFLAGKMYLKMSAGMVILVKYVRRTGCKKDDERIDCYGVNI